MKGIDTTKWGKMRTGRRIRVRNANRHERDQKKRDNVKKYQKGQEQTIRKRDLTRKKKESK